MNVIACYLVCLFLLAVSEDNAKEAHNSAQILLYEMTISLKMQTRMYQIGHISFNVRNVYIYIWIFDKI